MSVNTHYQFNTKVVKPTKKKSKKNFLFTLFFLVLNIGIIAYIAYSSFKGQGDVWEQSSPVFAAWRANIKYILIALAMPFIAILAESLKYFILIRNKTGVWNFRLSLRTVIMGKYYDNITPLSSGGQAFQIYYLKKDGVPLGTAAGLPFISFFLSQLVLVILSITILIYLSFHRLGAVNGQIAGFKVLAIIGTFTSIIVPAAVIGISIWPKLTRKIANGIVKMINKIKFIRHKEKHANTIYRTLQNYQDSMSQYKKSKFPLFICFLLSIVYKVAFLSVPYFVLRGCGATNVNYIEVFALTVVITVAMSFFPTPGNAGAAELSFATIFDSTLTAAGLSTAYLFWGMLYWRICIYFVFIVLGIIELIILSLKHKRRKAYQRQDIQETLYRVPVRGIRLVHMDQESELVTFSDEDIQCYLSKKVAADNILPPAPLKMLSSQDFSCLTDHSYIHISKRGTYQLLRHLDETKIYSLSLVVEKNHFIEEDNIIVDTGKQKSPLDIPGMHISTVQFIDYYYPMKGKTADLTDAYASKLTELGYETKVYTPKLKKKFVQKSRDVQRNYEICYTPSIRFPGTNCAIAIPKVNIKIKASLEPKNVVVFHAQTPFTMGRYALRMARRYDVPLVGSFRHSFYSQLKKPCRFRVIAAIVDRYGFSLYKRCDAIFVPSKESGQLLKKNGYHGDYQIVEDVYEKESDEKIAEKRAALRNKFQLTEKTRIVTCIVQTKEQKDEWMELQKKYESFRQRNTRFIVFGFSFLERTSYKKEEQDSVILISHRENLEDCIAGSDLVYLPRKEEGGFPFERVAAKYQVPSLLGFVPHDQRYIVNETVYEMKEQPALVAEQIRAILKKEDEYTQIQKNAYECLTNTREAVTKQLEKEYEIVIRHYYDGYHK